MDFFSVFLAALAANLVAIVAVYAIVAFHRGQPIVHTLFNVGHSAAGLVGTALRIYFIALAAFLSLVLVKVLLVG